MNFRDNNKFPKLNFADFSFKIKQQGTRRLIWDEIRLTWLVLTPEEWVRQHTIRFVEDYFKIAKSLIAVEYPANLGTDGTQRIDILCFNKELKPLLLIECKAPSVAISQDTLSQAVRYNSVIGAKHIMLTNGFTHFLYSKSEQGEWLAQESFSDINL